MLLAPRRSFPCTGFEVVPARCRQSTDVRCAAAARSGRDHSQISVVKEQLKFKEDQTASIEDQYRCVYDVTSYYDQEVFALSTGLLLDASYLQAETEFDPFPPQALTTTSDRAKR